MSNRPGWAPGSGYVQRRSPGLSYRSMYNKSTIQDWIYEHYLRNAAGVFVYRGRRPSVGANARLPGPTPVCRGQCPSAGVNARRPGSMPVGRDLSTSTGIYQRLPGSINVYRDLCPSTGIYAHPCILDRCTRLRAWDLEPAAAFRGRVPPSTDCSNMGRPGLPNALVSWEGLERVVYKLAIG